jgi:hypothetical protein
MARDRPTPRVAALRGHQLRQKHHLQQFDAIRLASFSRRIATAYAAEGV